MTRPEELDARGRRLRAALAATLVPDNARRCSSTSGSTTGMAHQGLDVQLTAYAARDWRANFFPIGIAHSIVGGTAWEPTPWRAVQRGGVPPNRRLRC